MSLSQAQYLVAEGENFTTTISKKASEDVIVEVNLSDRSANGNVECRL